MNFIIKSTLSVVEQYVVVASYAHKIGNIMPHLDKWVVPNENFLKFNVDTAFNDSLTALVGFFATAKAR